VKEFKERVEKGKIVLLKPEGYIFNEIGLFKHHYH